ncbi:MAG: hypothetical protein HZA04_03935 [Nitrospinae bacterium]|nr:hypothetical protein [Nitrospinota bacterium]
MSLVAARLILDGPRPARENMALDETLFTEALSSPYAATLRLYSWSPHAISLGRRQKLDAVNVDACRKMGIDVVKRPGGGAAVYHNEEITYCFVCRLDKIPLPGVGAWRNIFSTFLETLGVAPDGASPRTIGSLSGNACFACAAEDEPTIGGKKFAGSARRKSKTVFMQHGSILLKRQPDFLGELVKNAEPDASIGLTDILPGITAEKVSSVFAGMVASQFHLRFDPAGFTGREMAKM